MIIYKIFYNNNKYMNVSFILIICRDQIRNFHVGRALRSMKPLSNFSSQFLSFVQEESRLEAQGIVLEKDHPRTSFSLHDIRSFSYEEQFKKFQRTNPILVASILGTMSRSRAQDPDQISRKGFGGSHSGEDIDLIPSVVQTVSRVLKNRHSRSVSLIPCLNSLHLWGNRVPGHLFHFFNSLGDSFR